MSKKGDGFVVGRRLAAFFSLEEIATVPLVGKVKMRLGEPRSRSKGCQAWAWRFWLCRFCEDPGGLMWDKPSVDTWWFTFSPPQLDFDMWHKGLLSKLKLILLCCLSSWQVHLYKWHTQIPSEKCLTDGCISRWLRQRHQRGPTFAGNRKPGKKPLTTRLLISYPDFFLGELWD